MLKRISLGFLIMFFLIFAINSYASTSETTKVRTLTLGVTTAASMEFPEYASIVKFKETLEEKTDGQIIVEIYPASQLGKLKEVIEGTSMGTINAFQIGFDSISTVYPPVAVFNLPYLFKDIPHLQRVFKSEAGQKVLNKMIQEMGLRLVSVLYRGPRQMMNSKRPIIKPSDLKGLKIRVPNNPLQTDTLKALGATAVSIDFSEIYTALSQGLVDGYENPIDVIYETKGYETLKYLSLTGHMQSPIPIVINEKYYQSLSPELQKEVMAAGKIAEDYRLELLKTSEDKALEIFKNAGVKVNEIGDFNLFREATKDVYKKYVDEDTYRAILLVK